MQFCRNCGAELSKEDKFCLKCGTPVEDTSEVVGEKAEEKKEAEPVKKITEQEKEPESVEIKKPIDDAQIKNFANSAKKSLNDILTITISMIKKPIATVEYAIKSLTLTSTICLAGFLSVVFGILGIWATQRLGSGLDSSLTSGFSSYGYISNSMPYATVFVYCIIGMILSIVLIPGIIFIMDKLIYKSNNVFKSYLNTSVVSMIPIVIAAFLGLIFSYISITMQQVILIFGFIESVLCVHYGAKQLLKSEDGGIFAVALSYALTYFIMIMIITEQIKSSLSF